MFHIIDTATFTDLGNKVNGGEYYRYFYETIALRTVAALNRLVGYDRYFVQPR